MAVRSPLDGVESGRLMTNPSGRATADPAGTLPGLANSSPGITVEELEAERAATQEVIDDLKGQLFLSKDEEKSSRVS